ncbi:MAG TPA: leucyl/phenylalanyl-tRNA--protein transferase [Mycobacteriales bacterium]|nr:leucyl/phenylalanyl-tRNA--protein transferase [Mycobacteriales bacterium]
MPTEPLTGSPSGLPAGDPFAAIDVVGAPRELVALGGRLDPPTLLSAYRHGVFPWPATGGHQAALERSARRLARRGQVPVLPGDDADEGLVPWCSPEPRAVLLPDELRLSRSLRQRLRRSGWHASLDLAFDDVIAACADRADGTWITRGMQEGYRALHRAGHAHSVEVWDGDRLLGGLYGVQVGAVFCGESMFHRTADASKVALVELCARFLDAGGVLVDVQQDTAHLASLGAVLVHRHEYVDVVAQLRDLGTRLDPARRPVARLARWRRSAAPDEHGAAVVGGPA